MAIVTTIAAALELRNQQFMRGLDEAEGGVKDFGSSVQSLSKKLVAPLAAASGVLGGIANNLRGAGLEAAKFRQELSTSFSGTELDNLARKISEIDSTPPIAGPELIRAAKQFQEFGKDAEANLERVGNAAVKAGVPFGTLSQTVARFGIDPRATTQLEKLLNVDSTKLVQFGAVLDESGKKLDFTGENAAKAQKALEEFLDQNYAGALDAFVTDSERLTGQLTLLRRELGAGLAESFEDLAGRGAGIIETIRELPDGVKSTIGLGVALSAAAASGALFLATAGAIGPTLVAGFTASTAALTTTFAPAITAATAATASFNVTLGTTAAVLTGFGVVLAGVLVGLGLYTRELESANEASEALLETELQRAANQRDVIGLLGKSADELAREGKTAADVTNGILALQERIELARNTGNDALVKRLQDQVLELKAAKVELATAEKELRDEAAAEAEFNSPAAKAAREKAAQERKKQRDAEKAEDEKALAESLRAELDNIELRLAQEEISQAESLKLRAEALEKFKASEQEKRRLVIETARFQSQASNTADAEAAKKAEEAVRDAEEARKAILAAELASIDQAKAERSLSGEEELARLEEILKTVETSEKEKQGLLRRTAELRSKLGEEAISQAKKNAADLANAESEARNIRRDQLSDQVTDLQRETTETGEDNTSKIRAALEESLKLQIESIRLEAERAASATQSAEARVQIEKNAQARIQEAIKDTADREETETDRQIAAIEKLKKAREDSDGGGLGSVFGIEDLASNLEATFNTRATTGAPDLSGISSLASRLSNLQPEIVTPQQGLLSQIELEPVSGEIGIVTRVEVDQSGNVAGASSTLERADLNGQFSDVAIKARGTIPRVRSMR